MVADALLGHQSLGQPPYGPCLANTLVITAIVHILSSNFSIFEFLAFGYKSAFRAQISVLVTRTDFEPKNRNSHFDQLFDFGQSVFELVNRQGLHRNLQSFHLKGTRLLAILLLKIVDVDLSSHLLR